jgi:hypothetical protein
MISQKRICLVLLLLVAFLTPTVMYRCANQGSAGTSADGTAPPAPPIPWGSAVGQVLSADGTSRPAPPIPWGHSLNLA